MNPYSQIGNYSTVLRISIILRPKRPNLVTMSTSLFSILSIKRLKPRRSLATIEPTLLQSLIFRKKVAPKLQHIVFLIFKIKNIVEKYPH